MQNYIDATENGGKKVSGDVGLNGALKVPKISTEPYYIYGIVYVKGELSPFDVTGGLGVSGSFDESQSSPGSLSGSLSFGAQLSGSIKVAAGVEKVCSIGALGTAATTFKMTGTLTYSNNKLILSSQASMSKVHLEGAVSVDIGNISCKPYSISTDVGLTVDKIFNPITLMDNN